MPRKERAAKRENASLREALRRIISICRESRELHGGDPSKFRVWRLQVEQEAVKALDGDRPWTKSPAPNGTGRARAR